MIQIVSETTKYSLDYYATDPIFAGPVADLKSSAANVDQKLKGRTIWMINSTARGGGVAEMLPGMIALMNDLGIDTRWVVINSDRREFFRLTKRMHNLIHGNASAGMEFGPADAELYEAVNRENASSFIKHVKKEDVLIVHDPQPLPLGRIMSKEHGMFAVWRCHIGLDKRTDATASVWRFLKPFFDGYRHAIFTAPEYVPDYLKERYTIIHPAIDPLSHKNQELMVPKLTGILCNSGLLPSYEPVTTPDYRKKVQMILPDGTSSVPGEIGLLFRPVIVQISRWDRLKGWLPLLEAFVRLKRDAEHRNASYKSHRRKRRVELARLVLAGPDPSAVADDPEGAEVLQEVSGRYEAVEDDIRRDIAILLLPMGSLKENMLIVNAIQRCASVVVQNSIQEGFGLTATEAMWKRKPVLGSSACGIRQQIRDGDDGLLSRDPENPKEISEKLRMLLDDTRMAYNLGRSAQRRVYDHFLIFRQIAAYLDLLGKVL
jgi:trehalose synthase